MADQENQRWVWTLNAPASVETWCHACEGRGATLVPRMGMAGGEPVGTAQMQECTHCKATGKLKGLVPPV